MRKLVGFLKFSGDIGVKLSAPQAGVGKLKQGCSKFWILETFTDADWSSNKSHRKNASCGFHFLNGNFSYGAARAQRVISLSSCESELHAMISGCCDALFIKRCAEFLLNESVEHWQYTDNSAARQLSSRQGVGRVRHLSGKLLWNQDLVLDKQLNVGQVATQWNYSERNR